MSARPKTAFARRAEFYDCIVADHELSRGALAVAWRLVNHINDETGECFPSVERVAGQLNINERTVRRGVDQLVEAGWFTKKRRGRGGTQYFANYGNWAEVSAFSDGENRTGMSGKDDKENRAGMSAFSGEENRTESSENADKTDQENRTKLSAEPKGEPPCEPQGSPPGVPPVGDDEAMAVQLWNDLAERIGHPKVQRLSKARRKSLGKRLAECGGLEGWRVALSKVEASAFLRGDNDRGWRADFDFMLQAKSFTRLMEGSYDDNGRREGGGGRAGSQGDRKHSFLAGMFGVDNGRRP